MPAFCAPAPLLLQQLLPLTPHATAINWGGPITLHCPSLPSTSLCWAAQADMLSLLLPLRRSVLAAHFCPPSSRSARRPSSSLLQPHDFRLPLITPLDCPQLPATLRPGADLVPIPFCCSSTWTLGCGGKVMEGARPGCAIAAQQRVLAFRPSSSSLERLAGVLCCLDLSLPLGAIRRARFDDLSRSEYNYPPRFLSAWGKRPYRPSRLTSPLPSVCLFAGASSLLPRRSSPASSASERSSCLSCWRNCRPSRSHTGQADDPRQLTRWPRITILSTRSSEATVSCAAASSTLARARASSALSVACTFALAIASRCTTQMREGLVLHICDHG